VVLWAVFQKLFDRKRLLHTPYRNDSSLSLFLFLTYYFTNAFTFL
jgi:hypothetical protein